MDTWNAIFNYLIDIVSFEKVIIFWILYFFVIWISIIVWVVRDITIRSDNVFMQIISILTVLLLTPFWIFLYLLIRPSKTLFEKYYSEVENNLDCLWDDIIVKIWENNFKSIHCSNCWEEIKEEFKYCPYCKFKIKPQVLIEEQEPKKKKGKKSPEESKETKKSKKKSKKEKRNKNKKDA